MRLEPKPGTRLFVKYDGFSGGSRRLYEYDIATGTTWRIRIKDGTRICRAYPTLQGMLRNPSIWIEIIPTYLKLPEGF